MFETQQSPRVIFSPPPLIYGLGEKELPERAGHALCLQLIAESHCGRAFGNICHLTCQCFLFFIFFILLCYLAKQFMPSNPYFRNPGHFWYSFTSLKQSLHQFISQYLPAGTFLLTAKWFGFFLLSLSHGLCRGCISPACFIFPPSF